MTVLVTGGAGYIGSHAVLALRDAGEDVVVIDNLITGFPEAVPADVPLIRADIADAASTRAVLRDHRVTAIMHFAASIVVPESVAAPLKYYRNNTVATRQLLECAVEAGIRHFVFSSTAAVYGTVSGEPVSEDNPPAPVSPYGSSKLMSETMLRDVCAAHDLSAVILRYFNVAGADPSGRAGQSTKGATHLIKVAVETVLGKRPRIEVFGTDYPTPDGTCLRDYIHVSDLAAAHLDALRYLRAGGATATLNCGYGRGYSVLEVLDAVRRESNAKLDAVLAPRRPGDPAQIVASNARIKETLGWQPRLDDLGQIVRHALDWERRLKT